MPKNKTTQQNNDVGEALALLSETLTDEEVRIRDEGSKAMKTGAYDTAQRANLERKLAAETQACGVCRSPVKT